MENRLKNCGFYTGIGCPLSFINYSNEELFILNIMNAATENSDQRFLDTNPDFAPEQMKAYDYTNWRRKCLSKQVVMGQPPKNVEIEIAHADALVRNTVYELCSKIITLTHN